MNSHRPLKRALALGQEHWSSDSMRPEVRQSFQRVLACRTAALGAEVFTAGCGEQRVVYHTCKSRMCPSCGQRANQRWVRERSADLPEIPYAHVVLTMPDVLWPILQVNRHLLQDLPVLGAKVIELWVRRTYQAKQLIMVIPHTFGRDLKFNPHLHLLVSQGGLDDQRPRWLSDLPLKMGPIMRMWRYAVITLLRAAARADLLSTTLPRREFDWLLDSQYRRHWHVFEARMRTKGQTLRYCGRYMRRPPIAEHRFTAVNHEEVRFLTKDLKSRSIIESAYSLSEFITRLSNHVQERYRHNVRYFGLLAPRTKAALNELVFWLLGQAKSPKPKPLSWRVALRTYFRIDPLVDAHGHLMVWSGRIQA